MLRVLCVMALAAVASIADAGVMASSSLTLSQFRIVKASNGNTLQLGIDFTFVPPPNGGNSTAQDSSAGGSTSFAGAVVGPPANASATSNASAVINTSSPGSFSEFGDINNTAFGIRIIGAAPLNVFVEFNAALNLSVATTLGSTGIATSSFGITVLGNGDPEIFSTNPLNNGVGGRVIPFALNRSISSGSVVLTSPPKFRSQTIQLVANRNYTFSASQTATVTANNLVAVPEPCTLASFAAVGVFVAVGRRRRLK